MIPNKLPQDWVLRESKDYPGRVYYYNKATHESTWIRPVIYSHILKTDPNFKWPPLVYVSHILIKHVGSADAETWKKNSITRTRDEAYQKVLNIKSHLENGMRKFNEIANEESDDIETHEKGGEIGWIQRGETKFGESFDEAAFALNVDKMTDHPIETAYGWHLIYRLG